MNKFGFLNLLLIGALLAVLGLFAAMHTNPAKRNDYWLKGMDESPASQDFAVNPNFKNGQTLQEAPEGTLAQGATPYHYEGGIDGATKAGKEVRSPLKGDDEAVLKRGQVIFNRDCFPCHGPQGRGDGPVTAMKREGSGIQPPSLLADHAKQVPDGYIYNYIARGGILMPSYGAQIDAMDRWKAVAWVRHLQKTEPENAPADAAAVQPQAVPTEAPYIPRSDGSAPERVAVVKVVPAAEAAAPVEQPATVKPAAAAPVAAPTAVPVAAAKAVAAPAASAAAPAANAASGPVTWDQAKALMGKTDCLACHQPDKKVIGPSFKDVAKKYAGKADALVKLVKKVKAGGAGNWGQIPMAAHPQLSDQDIETMVKGILSLAGGHAAAPSLKAVMAAIHSGAPVRCPAVGASVNGPAFLAMSSGSAGQKEARP